MRNFGYYIREGVRNMFSHGFMSFAAVGITVACLVIMGTFTLVAINLNENLKDLERENEILAFVDETYTQEEAKALRKQLEAVPNVTSATFISKEEAMLAFQKEHPEEDLYLDLVPEIFRDRFALRVESLELMRETKTAVEGITGIADVNAYENVSDGFITFYIGGTAITLTAMAIAAIAGVALNAILPGNDYVFGTDAKGDGSANLGTY